ncbi:MAG: hypothetical protein ONB25_06495 [candidate division KSB1 bacterium]|nr:hypothetical protein [candidate division KSB1 bacterium]MDZ7412672.1 hypothetical protein [candidate division KSB1 bacterium]
MLFVHFTPKKNLKRIKRLGLRPGKGEKGVFLHPLLQGDKTLTNQWNAPCSWKKGTARHDQQMAKIVVRIPDDQMIQMGDMGDSRGAEPMTVAAYGQYLAGRNPNKEFGGPSYYPDGTLIKNGWTWEGHEVLYRGRIPPSWIVKILDRTDTDERTRRYRRQRRPGSLLPEETEE